MSNHEIRPNNFGEDDVFEWGSKLLKGNGFISTLKHNLSEINLEDRITRLLGDKMLSSSDYAEDLKKWFVKGMPCKILKLGAPGWQRGKVKLHAEVKITVEFCPDELELEKPESPLDDFRQR